MPEIIEYAAVLKRLMAEGLHCNYPNGGSFGFVPLESAKIHGWIGPADETIRESARKYCVEISQPIESNLASLATQAWQELLPGPLWLMPSSHWSFELHHGAAEWLPTLLRHSGCNPDDLSSLTTAVAIEFSPSEIPKFESILFGLLKNLKSSDFTLAFPGRETVCLVHHHKQLWWMTADDTISRSLSDLYLRFSSGRISFKTDQP
jgi:hypothetical protein